MSRATYAAEWGSIEVTISADWAQASCPIEGLEGWQVATARHRPATAMREALYRLAVSEGMDEGERCEKINEAMETMEEV